MKKILLAAFIAVLAVSSWGATTTPIQLLNPAGSTSGQAIVSTGPTTAPAWGGIAASAITGVVPLANGGTNAATAAAALTNLGGDAVGSITNKAVYVSAVGNDSNNGTSWGYAKLTLQAAINAASGSTGGVVRVGAGTYSLPSTVTMQPNVRLLCSDGATITQANSKNLSIFFDFSTNSANGASIQNCTIDGNRSNNTDNGNAITVYVGTANDVQIDNNVLQNLSGNGIEVTSGLRPKITRNRLTNLYTIGIAIIAAAQTPTYGLITDNQITSPLGAFAIGTVQSDYTIIQRNNILGSQTLGTNITISGTAVTWVSGPTFSASLAGQTIVYNGGLEANIKTVNSSTSITLSSAGTTVTNVPAIFGSADLLNVANSSFNNISDNVITGGATSSIVLHNFTGSESAQKNIISRNVVGKSGEGCIYLETTTGGSQLFDNMVIDNIVNNCGVGGTTAGVATNVGIGLFDFAPNSLLRTFISGNYVEYDGGGVPMAYWMDAPAIGAGQAFIGNNTGYNMTNPGIHSGISTVTLSAGWGTTASTSAITSYGNGFVLTVTSAGTGQANGPTVTVNTRATTATIPPVMSCQSTGGTGTAQLVYGQSPGANATSSSVLFAYNGTPVAGQTYAFLCKG